CLRLLGSVGQQCNVARLLDGRAHAALVRRAYAGQAPGDDLAALGHELAQQAHVLVVDGVNLLHAELAHLLAAEELARPAFAAAAGPALRAGTAVTASAGTRPAVATGTVTRRPFRSRSRPGGFWRPGCFYFLLFSPFSSCGGPPFGGPPAV